MLTWLQNNIGTIAVAVIVFGLLAAVAVKMIRELSRSEPEGPKEAPVVEIRVVS